MPNLLVAFERSFHAFKGVHVATLKDIAPQTQQYRRYMSICERMEDLKDRAIKNRRVNVKREHPKWSDTQVEKEVIEGTTVREMVKNKHKKDVADRKKDAEIGAKHTSKKVKIRDEYRNVMVKLDDGASSFQKDELGAPLCADVHESKTESGEMSVSVDVENDLILQKAERKLKEEDVAGVIDRVEALLGKAQPGWAN